MNRSEDALMRFKELEQGKRPNFGPFSTQLRRIFRGYAYPIIPTHG